MAFCSNLAGEMMAICENNEEFIDGCDKCIQFIAGHLMIISQLHGEFRDPKYLERGAYDLCFPII